MEESRLKGDVKNDSKTEVTKGSYLNLFVSDVANVKAENRLLKFFMVLLTAACIVSSYFSYKALNYQKTVILPTGFDRKITIFGDGADTQYIKVFTRYISQLFLTYSPAVARSQFSELLNYVHPSIFSDFQAYLYDLANSIEISNINSTFLLFKIKIEKVQGKEKGQYVTHGGTVVFTGHLTQRYKDGTVLSEGMRTYSFPFSIENGRFWIKGMIKQSKKRYGGKKEK